MTIAMPHSGRNAGSTVAEVNLKFLSNFHRCGPDRERQRRLCRRPGRAVAGRVQSRAPIGHGSQRSSPGRRRGQARRRTVGIRQGSRRTLGLDRRRIDTAHELVRLFRAAIELGVAAGLQLAVPDGVAARVGCAAGGAFRRADGAPHGRSNSRIAGRRAAAGSERFRPSHRRANRATKSRISPTISIGWRTSCRARIPGSSRRSKNAPAISPAPSAN